MPSSCSILALDSAGRLDRELATVARLVDDLLDLVRADARASRLVQAVAVAIVNAQQLRRHIVQATDCGRARLSVDVHERALRARMNIVMRALYALKSSEAQIPSTAFVGRFHTLRDVSVHLADRLAHIHSLWTEQRATYRQLNAWMKQTLAYQALDDAEIAFERLGRDRDLEHFVSTSAASASEAVSLASQELAVTFGIALAATDGAAATQPASCAADRSAS